MKVRSVPSSEIVACPSGRLDPQHYIDGHPTPDLASHLDDAALCEAVLTLVANNGPDRVAQALYAAALRWSRLEREHASNAPDPAPAIARSRANAYLAHLVGEAVRRAARP